jgi:iron complex outermembrane receptor protein
MRKRVQRDKNMTENRVRVLSLALIQALSAGVVASVATTAANAQTAQSVEKMEITGSRVKRADAEGALPVTVITRENLESSGNNTVAEVMRQITFTNAGNFRPQSGSSAQGFAEVNLRGLGSERTLVLIDGKRVAKSPMVGTAVDMNTIPLAAVERIEILTDGASAIYGSEAIGGVVNIITRKNFDGVAISAGATRVSLPLEGGDRYEANAVMGMTGEKGRFIIGANTTDREIIFQRDAFGSAGNRGASSFSNNLFASPGLGGFIGAIPGGCTNPNFYTAGGRCRYDFAVVAADEAALNTKSWFGRGEYNINADWTAYFTTQVNKAESFGRYAPVPGEVVIQPGSPAHPWHPAFPDPSYRDRVAEDQTIYLAHRFAAGGNRDTTTDSTLYDTMFGFKGRAWNADWDFGLRKSTSKYVEIGRGFVIETLARQAIFDGLYNVFDPISSPADVIASFTHTTNREGRYDQTEQYANATFDVFKMGGGSARLFLGAEHRKEIYEDLYDSLSEGGVVLGSSGNSAAGDRTVTSYTGELVMPITKQLEASLALRYDKYSDYGNDTSPKASVRYQPMKNLTLRASYGQGFAAPTLPQLVAKPAFSADSIVDERHCLADGNSAADCAERPSFQINGLVISNPQLSSESSDQWSIGAAWDITPQFGLKADFWDTKIEDVITDISAQEIVNRDNGDSPLGIPAGLSITRDATGFITNITRGATNEGTLKMRGIDLSFYAGPFNLGGWGTLRSDVTWSRVVDATSNGVPFDGIFGNPKDRALMSNTWKMKAFDFTWNINYIGDHGDDNIGYVGGYVTHDIQLAWHTPLKGLKIMAGAQNATEKKPPLVTDDVRPFDYDLYDGYGRQAYLKAEMKF